MSTRHLVAFVLAASMLGIGAAGPAAGMRLDRAPEPTPAALDALLGDLAAKPPIEKLGGQLAQIARVGEARQREWVLIQSTRPLELDAFSDRVHAFTWPAGEQVAVAEIAAADLLRVAALPGVYAIDGGPTDPAIRPPDIEAPAPQPYAELRARLDSAPDWTPPAEAAAPGQAPAGLAPDRASDPVTPDGWYDARSGPATFKVCSDAVFARRKSDGSPAWSYEEGVIINSTITVADGKLCFVESRHPDVKQSQARRVGSDELWEQQYLVALDLATGEKVWETFARPCQILSDVGKENIDKVY